jgi:hypothetical protein
VSKQVSELMSEYDSKAAILSSEVSLSPSPTPPLPHSFTHSLTHLELVAAQAAADDLGLERHSLLHAVPLEVAGQPRLPLLVHHQHELDHRVLLSALNERMSE